MPHFKHVTEIVDRRNEVHAGDEVSCDGVLILFHNVRISKKEKVYLKKKKKLVLRKYRNQEKKEIKDEK